MNLPNHATPGGSNQPTTSQSAEDSLDEEAEQNREIALKMFSSVEESVLQEYCKKFCLECSSDEDLLHQVVEHFTEKLRVPDDTILMTYLVSIFLKRRDQS